MEFSSGNMTATGSLNVNAVLKNTDGQFVVITRTFVFEQPVSIGGMPAGECFVSVLCDGADASLNNGKVNFNVDMKYSGFVCAGEAKKMLCSIEAKESGKAFQNENVVIYYAHTGESLWDIAKENRSTVEQISVVNDISTEVIRQDCVLVFPNF